MLGPHRTAATKIDTYASIAPKVSTIHTLQITPPHPPEQVTLIIVIIQTTDDKISPSLYNRKNLINTNILSDVNLMMAGIDRNM